EGAQELAAVPPCPEGPRSGRLSELRRRAPAASGVPVLRPLSGRGPAPDARRAGVGRPLLLALLFPGQGSQRGGMARDAAETCAAARAVFEVAERALDLPLARLCFDGPEEALLATEVQQPAILAASVALLRALEERVGAPLPVAYLGGHSLGEYTALVASGALALEDALRLVRARGAYMQEAVPAGVGAMAAILGADPEMVEAACARARERTGAWVEPANFNAPGQTVISGHAEAVEQACEEARGAGARRATRLAVSA